MDKRITFPREVNMHKAGIFYKEEGPNVVFLNIVVSDDTVKLIVVIDQDEIGNAFSAMTYGHVIETITLADALDRAKIIETQVQEDDLEED